MSTCKVNSTDTSKKSITTLHDITGGAKSSLAGNSFRAPCDLRLT